MAKQWAGSERSCHAGSGAGLPSIVAALEGAELVVATDFPEPSLLENLQCNADRNLDPVEDLPSPPVGSHYSATDQTLLFKKDLRVRFKVLPHRWGDPTSLSDIVSIRAKFDIALLADLVRRLHAQEYLLPHTLTFFSSSSQDQQPLCPHQVATIMPIAPRPPRRSMGPSISPLTLHPLNSIPLTSHALQSLPGRLQPPSTPPHP